MQRNHEQFQCLRKEYMRNIDKSIRYNHHIEFLDTYVRKKKVPKGFTMKFHGVLPLAESNGILLKCSKKLMTRTIAHYKCCLEKLMSERNKLFSKIRDAHPERLDNLFRERNRREEHMNRILLDRRTKKFERDGLLPCDQTPNPPQSDHLVQSSETLRNDILNGFELPSYDPIMLMQGDQILPEGLTSLCAKGPSFVPTQKHVDWLQIQKDFDRFKNTIRCKMFFASQVENVSHNTSPDTFQPPKKPSSWRAPKSKVPEVETFISCVEKDLFSSTNVKPSYDNLSRLERSSLDTWRKEYLFKPDGNLVMRLQDKGNRFVLVDKPTDMEKAKEQIARSAFRQLDADPTNEHVERVSEWARKWVKKKEISKEWGEYVINTDAVPGKNATLYKTHKQGNPVRLLTTGCNSAIENLSRFVERVCAPLTEHIPSRIKDNSHMLEIVDRLNEVGFPRNTLLVSLDIVNMFPNIDNYKGMGAVEEALGSRSINKPSTACVMDALSICLFNNNSVFANQHLLQINGTATGAPNSCSYSDLAVVPIDNKVNAARGSSFREVLFYGRYRDDCFLLWNGRTERLSDFLAFMNSLDEKIKFTLEIGGDSLAFLDLKITIQNGRLETTVYSKPTDSHLYLHASSCHNKSSIEGIQKGVALRLRRICSRDEDYQSKSREYSAYLVGRGHDPKTVVSNFKEVGRMTRSEARRKKVKDVRNNPIIFSTMYSPQGPNVREIIKRHQHLLGLKTADVFPDKSIMVAYKRGKNLKDLMVRGDPYNMRDNLGDGEGGGGYIKCGRKCESCDFFVIADDHVKCFASSKTYKVRRHLKCDSRYVVYMAVCIVCNKQGVGSTFDWKPRMRNYKSHISKQRKTCRIVRHFIEEHKGYENLRFVLLDCVDNVGGLSTEEIDALLLEKEKFWIGTLVTQHKGLNSTHDWVREKRNDREKDLD